MSPLSEREQKILEEIEKELYEEDPNFARGVKRVPVSGEVRRFKIAVLTIVAGFLLLVAFFVSQAVVVGVLAFAAMVAGIVLAAGSARGLLSGRSPFGLRRERLARALGQWEQRIRERYKRI